MAILTSPIMIYGEESPGIKIAAVEAPLETLTELSERTEMEVKTHAQALPDIKVAKRIAEEPGGQIDIAHDTTLNCKAYFDLYRELTVLPHFECNQW
jgi:hypothetical protein